MQTPKIYENVPPAPAGLLWWHYAPGVPPLPNPEEYFHNSSWSRWGWRYNDQFQQVRAAAHAVGAWQVAAVLKPADRMLCTKDDVLQSVHATHCCLCMQSNYQFSSLDRSTMTNISDNSWRLWVHLISTYVVSIHTYKASTAAGHCLDCLCVSPTPVPIHSPAWCSYAFSCW